MAQRTAEREATPFSTDPGGELPVGLQLSWRLRALIATGRLAGRRAAAQLPPPRRVGRGQRQHRARGLRRSRAGRAGGQPPGPGHLRRRRDRGGARAGGDRGRGAAARARCGPRPARAGRSSPPPAPAWPGTTRPRAEPPRRPSRPGRGERGDRGAPRAAPPDRPARGRARRLHPRPAAPTCRPRRALSEAHVAGVEELEQTRDTLIAQLSEAQRAAELRARQAARPARARSLLARRGAGQLGRGPARQGDELVAGEAVTRAFAARQVRLRAGGGDDDPHRADDRLRGPASLSLRRGAGRPVPLRPQALLVPAADLDLRPLPRRARAAGGRRPLAVRRARPARRLLRRSPRSAGSARSSPPSSSPASPAPRSPPTSAPARSARSSTPCRCSASTRSRTWSCRASWR